MILMRLLIGELYPLRRHHSSSDQLRSFELSIVKLKNQSENSSMVRKMPQLPKPSECVSFDMSSLNLEIKKLSDSDPTLSFEKKHQTYQSSEKCRWKFLYCFFLYHFIQQ